MLQETLITALMVVKLLWAPGTMPGPATDKPEETVQERGIVYKKQVSEPDIAFFPAKGVEKAPVVLICPGGGYQVLAYDKEGTEIARWLNGIGVHGAVLKYRVPGNRAGALADAQQALKLLEAQAEEWKIDASKIGMMGFSAGAHLTARVSAAPLPEGGVKPAFQLLIYPAYLSDDAVTVKADTAPSKSTPPTFIAQPRNDTAFIASGVAYSEALRKLGVPVEFHMFTTGGHGFGLRADRGACALWPLLAEAWMMELGIIPKNFKKMPLAR